MRNPPIPTLVWRAMTTAFSEHYRASSAAIAGLMIWLTACSAEPDKQPPASNVAQADIPNPANVVEHLIPVRKPPIATMAARPTTIAAVDAPDPNGPPTAEEKSEKGARNVLATWALALEHHDWATARAQWGHAGSDAGMDPAAFETAYQKYDRIKVVFGDGDAEGGAGSIYYEVPVTITGTLRTGEPFRLEGPVTLRRVNDVDGATPEQLRWHIMQSALKPRPS